MEKPRVVAHTQYRYDAACEINAALCHVRNANAILENIGYMTLPISESELCDAFNKIMKEKQ